MAGYNLKSQAKRKRELAKKDKRDAKDEKRALRKAEQRTAVGAGVPLSPNQPPLVTPPPVRSALEAAVAGWKLPPVADPRRRVVVRRAQAKSG